MTTKTDVDSWVGKRWVEPSADDALPEAYYTASGRGIRLDQPKTLNSAFDFGARITMPPTHWRLTMLSLLHLTEGHDVDGYPKSRPAECDLCAEIAHELSRLRSRRP